ncbi:MAG: transglycosylase SLT domain-containing protein [Gemmatimonadales bacterium]
MGLMRVMPGTRKDIARALRIPRWNADALLDPATNIRFGTYHLAGILRRFEGDLSRASPPTTRAEPGHLERLGRRARSGAVHRADHLPGNPRLRASRIIERNLTLYQALYGG